MTNLRRNLFFLFACYSKKVWEMEHVNGAMTQVLEEMIRNAFSRLSCARFNDGLFAELEQLAKDAYRLGSQTSKEELPVVSSLDISGNYLTG